MLRPLHAIALAAAAAVAVLGAVGGGCQSCGKGAAPAASGGDDLSLVPVEANFTATVSFKKLRGSSVWKKLVETPDQTPEQKARYADFVQQTGLDPLKQIDSLFVALPATPSAGEFAAILRGGPFDEDKLIAYMKSDARKEGTEITVSEHGGKKRYSDGRSGTTYGVFLDKKTLVLASDAWSRKIIDLAAKAGTPAAEPSARKNEALIALVKRAHTDDAIWGVGIVPPEARERLGANPDLKSAGSMKDVLLSIDLGGGFKMDAVVDLGAEADAKDLADKLKEQVTRSRSNPQIQLMGLGHYFDGVKVSSQGPALHVDVKLDQAGVDDLVDRLSGLFKGAASKLGGALQGDDPGPAPGQLPEPPPAAPAPAAPAAPAPAPAAPAPAPARAAPPSAPAAK